MLLARVLCGRPLWWLMGWEDKGGKGTRAVAREQHHARRDRHRHHSAAAIALCIRSLRICGSCGSERAFSTSCRPAVVELTVAASAFLLGLAISFHIQALIVSPVDDKEPYVDQASEQRAPGSDQ